MDIAKQETRQAQNPFSQVQLRPDLVAGQIGLKVPTLNIDFGQRSGSQARLGIQLTPKMLGRMSLEKRDYEHYESGKWLEPEVRYLGFGFSDLYSGIPEIPEVKYILFSNSSSGYCMTLKTVLKCDPFIFTSVESPDSPKIPPPAGLVFSHAGKTMGLVPVTGIRAASVLPKSAIPIVPVKVPLVRSAWRKKDMIERLWSFTIEPSPRQKKRMSVQRQIVRILKRQ
ncbi:MAG TPA: hypothetical protein PLO51_06315 [Candidatus Micrarchaeota archaeon]|nr:hypothetical protein [Candidatus Micrarchaeota archaeon]